MRCLTSGKEKDFSWGDFNPEVKGIAFPNNQKVTNKIIKYWLINAKYEKFYVYISDHQNIIRK